MSNQELTLIHRCMAFFLADSRHMVFHGRDEETLKKFVDFCLSVHERFDVPSFIRITDADLAQAFMNIGEIGRILQSDRIRLPAVPLLYEYLCAHVVGYESVAESGWLISGSFDWESQEERLCFRRDLDRVSRLCGLVILEYSFAITKDKIAATDKLRQYAIVLLQLAAYRAVSVFGPHPELIV